MSEDFKIGRFEPRPTAGLSEPVVWAVSAERLRNYLLPRDCPRVTFFAGVRTSDTDRQRFLGSTTAVMAFEVGWLERVRRTRLACYRLPDAGFRCVDVCAGYFHSTEAVEPIGIDVVEDLLGALVERGVEVRILPSLWELHDAVVGSTLSYSMIRMRNAGQRGSDPGRAGG